MVLSKWKDLQEIFSSCIGYYVSDGGIINSVLQNIMSPGTLDLSPYIINASSTPISDTFHYAQDKNGIDNKAILLSKSRYEVLYNSSLSAFNFLHSSSNSGPKWTVCVWMKRINFVSVDSSIVLIDTSGAQSTGVIGACVYMGDNCAISVRISNGVQNSPVIENGFSNAYPNDIVNYHFVCITYDQSLSSGNLRIYVDDNFIGSINKTGNTPSSSNPAKPFTMNGAYVGPSYRWYYGDIAISEIGLFTSALLVEQIKMLYMMTKTRYPVYPIIPGSRCSL